MLVFFLFILGYLRYPPWLCLFLRLSAKIFTPFPKRRSVFLVPKGVAETLKRRTPVFPFGLSARGVRSKTKHLNLNRTNASTAGWLSLKCKRSRESLSGWNLEQNWSLKKYPISTWVTLPVRRNGEQKRQRKVRRTICGERKKHERRQGEAER